MSVARRFAAALAVVGTGVLAYAVPASATDGQEGEAGQCVDGTVASNLDHHIDPGAGTATVEGKGPLCAPVDVILAIYKVPDTWNGSEFPAGGTAVSQSLIAGEKRTLETDGKLSLSVPVQTCGNVQIDLYYPPEITTVTESGHGQQFIEGYIWSIGGPNGQPKKCEEQTPTPPLTETVVSPPPSETTPAPSPSESTPVPSPTESTPVPSPTESTPVPSPTESTPVPSPSETPTPTPSETRAVPTPTPVESLGAPLPVTPPQAPPPPVLAKTGSNSTVPLLGLGVLLLAAGVGLSLIGRRRTA